MRKVLAWLARQPLWLQAAIVFPLLFGCWTGAVYLAAWDNGGPRPGYMGFPHGPLSYPDAFINPAILTAIYIAQQWSRRTGQTRKRKISGDM